MESQYCDKGTMQQFTLNITDLQHGNMTVCVSAGKQSYTFSASYIEDTPYYLAISTIALIDNVYSKTRCLWQDEPGEHRWIAEHRSDGTITLKILWFARTFSHRDDNEGKLAFYCERTSLRFVTQIKGQLLKLKNEYGINGYAAAWRHEFPERLLEFLERLIEQMR